MPNLIGQSLGRYHILEQLGEGGMATVYKAYDTRLEREVAVKVIRVEQFGQAMLESILKRFDREAKALAKLSHANIVGIMDYGEQDGTPFLVMEYLPGGTLKERMGNPIPWQEAVHTLLPVARALDFAHSQGMIHRDVKPSNILITASGDPMLTDFGIAKILDVEAGQTLTGTGTGMGTPEYMAPEQWTGKATNRSDIYSLGVCLYEMVTGRKPYIADTPAAILIKQINDPLPRPSQFVANLPGEVEQVLFKALAKTPEDRYQSMNEFAAALEHLLAGQPVPAREVEATLPAAAALRPTASPEPALPPDQAEPELAAAEEATVIAAPPAAVPPAKAIALPAQTPPADKRRGWPWAAVAAGVVIVGLAFLAIRLMNRPAAIAPTQTSAATIPVVPVPIPTDTAAPKIKIGEVTDLGGVNDKSFNASAWKGVQDAMTQLGVDGKFLQSTQQSDYAKNIQQMLTDKSDLIITVGFLLGVDTATAAKANPGQKFAIVDYTYPDCYPGAVEGKDCGSSKDLPNVRGLAFQTDQAAFLAGYLAAGMTKTGTVGTFGGIQLPTVTIFMDGFVAGVKYYNQKHSTTVKVLGWDTASQKGTFVGNFTSTDDGKNTATSLAQEGADIILPVAGAVGLGSAAYCQTSAKCLIIGVDTDWFVSSNEYASIELSSVQKKIDVAVLKTITDVVNGKFTGGTVTYTLADGGVDLAPYHNFDSKVPQALKDEIAQAKADIISGKITVASFLK